MDSEVVIFGTTSLFAAILALAVLHFNNGPADGVGPIDPPFYDVVQRAPIPIDPVQR